jgi:outer membrane protein OmpA-like peptidoglycan-associated protein
MRIGGISAALAAPLLLAGCALPAEPRMACNDAVTLHFARDGAELNLDAVGKVLLTVSTLEACPGAHATVTGHADIGEVKSIARARASNVASVMAKNGIDQRRIVVDNALTPAPANKEPDNRFVSIRWE